MGSLLHTVRGWRRREGSAGRGATARRRRTPRYSDADRELDRARITERARFVQQVDIELQVACRSEAASRHELGIVARALLRGHAYRRLGFVRLSDYARERLGVSARTLHCAAWVATRLDALPAVATAFDRSDLSWAQVRAVCAVASRDDQEAWLARARTCTVAELERISSASRQDGTGADDPDAEDGTIDGEPAMHVRVACPARVRALWRRALELASRAAGEPLAAWRAVEIIAAEAFSGRPAGVSIVERAILASLRLARRARRSDSKSDTCRGTDAAKSAAVGAVAAGIAPDRCTEPTTAGEPPVLLTGEHADTETPDPVVDPFVLDARLVAAMQAIRTSEPRIGRLLRIVVDQHVYRANGFDSLADYVRERLGISARKAWALLKVEKSTRRGDHFARAYESGSISWVCALTLLPVVHRENAAAWIARADAVTVRRLAAEVSWVLEARDFLGGDATLDPPPLDSALESPVARAMASSGASVARASAAAPASVARESEAAAPPVQIGAHAQAHHPVTNFDTSHGVAAEVADAEIHFFAPASVVALFRETLDAYAESGAPRWAALERVLQHVIAYWEATPRHRDPIFARDGWQCAVPGCSSRRNLHDHHLHYRSRGGGNAPTNRVTVCASHHLHGIHGGVVRASGTAPRDVHWQLGVRPNRPPLLTYVGDRRCVEEMEVGVLRPPDTATSGTSGSPQYPGYPS